MTAVIKNNLEKKKNGGSKSSAQVWNHQKRICFFPLRHDRRKEEDGPFFKVRIKATGVVRRRA